MQSFFAFLPSTVASATASYIRKWLDGKKYAAVSAIIEKALEWLSGLSSV